MQGKGTSQLAAHLLALPRQRALCRHLPHGPTPPSARSGDGKEKREKGGRLATAWGETPISLGEQRRGSDLKVREKE